MSTGFSKKIEKILKCPKKGGKIALNDIKGTGWPVHSYIMATLRGRIEKSIEKDTTIKNGSTYAASPVVDQIVKQALKETEQKQPVLNPNIEYARDEDGNLILDRLGRAKSVKQIAFQEANKKRFAELTPEQRSEQAIKAAATRARRRTTQDAIRDILDGKADPAAFLDIPEMAALVTTGRLGDIIAAKMVEQAAFGNVNAFLAVRDSAGDKPVERSEATVNLSDSDRQMLEMIGRRLENQDVVAVGYEVHDI